MELKNYPISKENDYEALAHQMEVIADVLATEDAVYILNESEELTRTTYEVLHFLKSLVQ